MKQRDTELKIEFARRLQAALVRKGWNQSELVRRANPFLPKPTPGQKRGKQMGRDNISHYVRAKMLPSPTYLDAIARALGTTPEALLPRKTPVPAGSAPIEMVSAGDGRVYIRLNRTVTQEAGLRIMAILAEEDKGA